jgi:hypothetical protein
MDSEQPQKIMSRAERRRAKKPAVVMTTEMKAEKREKLIELRRFQRMLKSNGSRGKYKKWLREKRGRDENSDDDAESDSDETKQLTTQRMKAHRSEGTAVSAAARPEELAPAPPKAPKLGDKRDRSSKTDVAKRRERVARIAKFAAAAGGGGAKPSGW